jgi:hypothetical protein
MGATGIGAAAIVAGDRQDREQIPIHQRSQSAGYEFFLCQKIQQRGAAETGHRCRRESRPVVGFESPLRMHGDPPVAVNEAPRLGALHET